MAANKLTYESSMPCSPKLSTALMSILAASEALCLSPSLGGDVIGNSGTGIEKKRWSSCSFEGSLKFRSWVDIVDMTSTSNVGSTRVLSLPASMRRL